MIKNYLLTAFRNIKKHKGYSLINIIGLAVGMAACLLILQYVGHERSYDGFHKNADNIYRVLHTVHSGEDGVHATTYSVHALGPQLKKEFPGVVEYARLFNFGDGVVMYKDAAFKTIHMFFADTSFLTMFSFPLIKGDPATALADPYCAVISESTARKLFKDEDPIGETIEFNCIGNWKYTVKGIYKDIPVNSHVQFDVLLSLHQILKFGSFGNGWKGSNFFTYVLLTPNANPKALEAKLPKFLDRYIGEESRENNTRHVYSFQPLEDIYLHTHPFYPGWRIKQGNMELIYLLSISLIFILILTWGNHIHLSTAVLRRVVGTEGASRIQLVKQFTFESLFFHILGAIAAIIIVKIAMPGFNKLIGSPLPFSIPDEVTFWLVLAVMIFIGSLLTGIIGIFSTFIIPSNKPVTEQEGKLRGSGMWLRKCLVTFQLSASLVLITCTITVYKQVEFMRNHDLGMNTDQVLLIGAPLVVEKHKNTYQNMNKLYYELIEKGMIQSATIGSTPGMSYQSTTDVRRENGPTFRVKRSWSDGGFIPTLQLKLLAGRNFSGKFPSDIDSSVIINKAASDLLGFESPEEAIDQIIIDDHGKSKLKIIGVTKNYFHLSLKHPIEPLIFRYPNHFGCSFFTYKLKTGNLSEKIAVIKDKWEKLLPGNPFEYVFLDEFFDRQYDVDKRFEKTLAGLTLVAIVIVCIGLIGLAASAHTTLQQTKEKALLLKDLIKMLFISMLIAFPIAYFVSGKWLENYAYRIGVGWWFFAIPVVIIIPIVLLILGIRNEQIR